MSRYYGGWAPYVPVAERRAKAQRKLKSLEKKGRICHPVTIEGRHRHGAIRLAIIDRGPGLPPGREHEVFETFRRLEGSDRAVGGTGLGLAIVKAFAEAMGMTTEAGNHGDGAGAAFTLVFPAALIVRTTAPESAI